MTLTELVTVHGMNISINFSIHTEKWYVSMDAEIKDNGLLTSPTEHRAEILKAVHAFIGRIRGKTLVMYATTEHRKEFKVPSTLTL